MGSRGWGQGVLGSRGGGGLGGSLVGGLGSRGWWGLGSRDDGMGFLGAIRLTGCQNFGFFILQVLRAL